jgi:hypothetical protein
MAIGPQGELVFVGLAETFIPGPGKKVRFAYTTLEIVSPGAPPVLPTLSIAGTSATEGAAAVFTVNLSSAGNQAVTVNYATAHGTAGSKDYRGTNKGKLTIPAGHSSGTIRIATAGDKLDEDDETFLLTLTGANGAQLPEGGAATVTGTIVDDDLPPVLSVADARATETSSGNAAAVFAVRLSAASGKPITLDWATADGTAKAGSDYAALADSLRFEPGEKSKKISVPILDDLLDEADETFRLELSNAVNATPGRTAATGTVRDNDPPPKLSITDTSIAEEGGAAVFTVTLSAVSGRTVSVNYATADGTAKAGLDYTATNGTLIFEPGVVSQTILVPILDDQLSEVNETLKMNLSRAVGASLQRGKATATIVDDEPKQVSSLQSSWSADFSIASGLPRRTAGTTTWLKSRLAAAQDEALWQIMLAHGREEDRKSF